MPVLYTNNAVSTLSASITNVATSFSVAAGHGARFPSISGADYFYATLVDSAGNIEIVRVTARATDTFTVTRGQDGTAGRAYSVGDRVELRITRSMLDDFKTDTRSALTSGNVTTALGFTPYNSTNPSGYITNSTSTFTTSGATTLRSGGDNQVSLGGLSGITLGNTGHTGVITIGQSTLSEGINIGAGAHGATRTKTINIGTNGAASSVTTIAIGSTNGTTVTANGAWTYSGTLAAPTLSTSGAGGSVIIVGRDNSAQNFQEYVTGNVWRVFSSTAGTDRLNLDSAGNLVASGNVTANSDERLKTDWAGLPGDFIERLATVKSGTYTRIDTGERQAGASAQDMQRLLAEVVMTSSDERGTLTLAYGNAALVSAIELSKRILRLEAQLAKLIET